MPVSAKAEKLQKRPMRVVIPTLDFDIDYSPVLFWIKAQQ
jgi:hypothetical protein